MLGSFYGFSLTLGRVSSRDSRRAGGAGSQSLAANPRVTYREETHSTLECKLRPLHTHAQHNPQTVRPGQSLFTTN